MQKCPIPELRLHTGFKVDEHFHVDPYNLVRVKVGILTGFFRRIETVFRGLGHIAGGFYYVKDNIFYKN